MRFLFVDFTTCLQIIIKMKVLKKYFLLSFSILLFFVHPDDTRSCGPYFDEYDDYYKIFEEDLFNPARLKPFLLSDYIFNKTNEDGSLGPRLDNLKDWLKYLNNKPVIDDLEKFIYKTSLEDLHNFLSNPESLKPEWKDNSVFAYADKNKLNEAVNYLVFAKLCEPQVALKNPWDEIDRDTLKMNKLLDTAAVKIKETKNLFFRERYTYQAIRLAHYSGQFQKTISLFEKYRKNFKKGSLMYYWSLADYAGAIRSIGNSARANIIFADVFDNCPSRSRQSVLSFRYWNDSLFTETLKQCKNDHDKVLVYTIAAYKAYSLNLEAIKKIYQFEPKSPYLTLILSRAVAMVERDNLPQKHLWEGYKAYLKSDDYFWNYYIDKSLYQTVFKIADEKKTGNDYLWNYAAGYIAALMNHTDEAEKYFFEAKKVCPKNNLDEVKRIQIAELICKVNSLTQITDSTETFLNVKMQWLKKDTSLKKLHSEDAFLYIINTLAKKYWTQGDTIKAHLCFGISGRKMPWENFFTSENPFDYNIAVDYNNEPVMKLYNTLKANAPWDNVSKWMQFLTENYYYTVDELEDILVKEYISKGMFSEVVENLQPRYNMRDGIDKSEALPADPFLIHINDCHDCDFALNNTTKYTLLGFSRKMIQLQNQADTENDPEKKAQFYFLLANGYYNITYYGNSWMASAYKTRGQLSTYYTKDAYFPLYDVSKAKKYYLMAAELSKDMELEAKYYFMAAKCEQNEYYNIEHPPVYEWYKKNNDDPKAEIKNEKYRNYFRKLVNEYSDTEFYKEVLEECKYFNNFSTKIMK